MRNTIADRLLRMLVPAADAAAAPCLGDCTYDCRVGKVWKCCYDRCLGYRKCWPLGTTCQ